MKIKLNELVNALGTVIVTTKNDKDKPILKGILFTEDNGVLVIQSTDLIDSSIVNIKCESGSGESFCVEGKFIFDVVRKLNSEYIEFNLNKNKLLYKTDNFEGEFELLKADDFPTLTGIQGNKLKIKGSDFIKVVRDTTYASTSDDSRPFLEYINFQIVNNVMWATGLDGYRVAHVEIPVEIFKEEDSEDVLNYNIRASFLEKVVKNVSEDTDVKVVINNKDIVLNIGGNIHTSKLYQGEFIDFRQLLPTEFKTAIAVNKDLLLKNLTTLLALKEEGKLKVTLNLKDSNLEIYCQNKIGNMKSSIEVGQDGNDIDIHFNIQYLIDMLRAVESEEIYIQMNTPETPVILRPNSENEKYLCMVLPIK